MDATGRDVEGRSEQAQCIARLLEELRFDDNALDGVSRAPGPLDEPDPGSAGADDWIAEVATRMPPPSRWTRPRPTPADARPLASGMAASPVVSREGSDPAAAVPAPSPAHCVLTPGPTVRQALDADGDTGGALLLEPAWPSALERAVAVSLLLATLAFTLTSIVDPHLAVGVVSALVPPLPW